MIYRAVIRLVLGQKPRRTKAPKDRSPAILAARTEAPRLKNNSLSSLNKMNALYFLFLMFDYKHDCIEL